MSDDPVTARLMRRALPVVTALASLLLVVTVAGALYFGRDILVPVALAILLSFVLLPAVRVLRRMRVPRAAAVLVVVVLAFGILAAVGGLIAREAAQLATDLPRYSLTLRDKITALRAATAERGGLSDTFSGFFDMAEEVGKELQPPAPETTGDARLGTAERPMQVEIHAPRSGLLKTLGSVAGGVLHPLATLGLILLFTIFILLQREDLRNRAIRLAGSSDLRRTTAAIDDATGRLSRFFLAQLALNLAFGVVIGLGLWAIGVPSPILFGVIAGISRFVPYIGAVISAVLPLAIAVAVDPGWSMAIEVALLFVIVEPIAGHVVEPLLYGHSTGISPMAVILAATIWTFLWGPIGLLLATPLTVCLVVLGRHVERLWFLDVILGDRPALGPQEIFYQRMLAGDPAEAIEQGRLFLKERALVTYYDEVVLASLRMAQEDAARGSLDRARQGQVGQSVRTVVETLGQVRARGLPFLGRRQKSVSAEAEAAFAAVGPDRSDAAIVLRPDDLAPGWRGATPVLCVMSAGAFDEAATLMLAQTLTRHGLSARAVSQDALRDLTPEQRPAMICFSYLDPISLSQIRLTLRRARQALPGVSVMVGFWRERDPASLGRLRRQIAADRLVTSLGDALGAALEQARAAPEPMRRAAE
ncbi:transporter [Methylobacterium sp. Leaf456]|uniref:AI-2E family transporter n=1 Tax=Methylobacterium sp. Leaf456 TaxID=1736382 RepID=UPI0006FD06C3|nr:AI-2E family transporter [Methylobacterium sp. Leaf456]KQT60834.1 transporter [Methylobacterium sp. Leaf456]